MKTQNGGYVVVLGSSNTDLVINCDRLPQPGETVLGGCFSQHAGGKGANQAVAAARAGAHVSFIGGRGADDFGHTSIAGLEREGIDTRFFEQKQGAASGVALILLQQGSGENMIAVARSANDEISEQDVENAEELFRAGAVLVCQGEIPMHTVLFAARLARKRGMSFILNPAPAGPLPPSLYELVDVLVPNETEAALLTDGKVALDAANELIRMKCRRVIVTLGARGVLLHDGESLSAITAPPVAAVDAVGAGDCFVGWLAAGMAEGLQIDEAARRAVRAASISVTRQGAQPSMPFRNKVDDLI